MRFLTALPMLVVASACVPDAGRSDRATEAYLELLAAEDARPTRARDGLSPLLRGLSAEQDLLRQASVRALGRLESPGLAHEIVRLVDDPAPSVRAEAANALAQAAHRGDGRSALAPLLERVHAERDPAVRSALARALGRLRVEARDRGRIVEALRTLGVSGEALATSTTLLGVALGFESLVRGSPDPGLSDSAARLLTDLASYDMRDTLRSPDAPRIRRLAIATLAMARRLDHAGVGRALRDNDPGVRATAIRHLDLVAPGARAELIRRALADDWMYTRVEAVRQIERLPRSDLLCRYLDAVVRQDPADAGRILALDALGEPCPDLGTQASTLIEAAASLGQRGEGAWQVPAHALVSLARIAPDSATALLPSFAEHRNPFVRAYAARAAQQLGDYRTLRSLAADAHPNVRVAVLPPLFQALGHAMDDLLLAQLAQDDPHLLMVASDLLEGSPSAARTAAAALDAFERISQARRETWRDARRSLLRRVTESGDGTLAPRLRPYLRDYDALVAQDVSRTLETWTGRPQMADPRPLPRLQLPTPVDISDMEHARVVLHMRDGGSIGIELFPFDATTNAFRFMRLAREGYFDGLTFHRWAPAFVIQGGSPGANEYQGAAAYTRDEVGLQPHWRGTVGISTRGRDTGDGQIFINLVDNVRLDHDYTVIGAVSDGLDLVDAVLEGAVIERAEVVVGS